MSSQVSNLKRTVHSTVTWQLFLENTEGRSYAFDGPQAVRTMKLVSQILFLERNLSGNTQRDLAEMLRLAVESRIDITE